MLLGIAGLLVAPPSLLQTFSLVFHGQGCDLNDLYVWRTQPDADMGTEQAALSWQRAWQRFHEDYRTSMGETASQEVRTRYAQYQPDSPK